MDAVRRTGPDAAVLVEPEAVEQAGRGIGKDPAARQPVLLGRTEKA